MDLTSSTLAAKLRDRAKDARPNSAIVATAAIAKRLRHGMFVGGRSLTREEFLDMFSQRITELHGKAVLTGLGPRKMPPNRCRWCLVRVSARVKGTSVPKFSPALEQLLGPQCRQCRQAAVSKAAGHAAFVTSARAKHSKFNALVASGTVVARDSKGRPTRLRTGGGDCGCGGTPSCCYEGPVTVTPKISRRR